MATRYVRADPLFGSIGTSRILSIPTSPATLITLGSGYGHMGLMNIGSTLLVYGGTGVAENSGATLFVYTNKEFGDLQDGWQIYVRAVSATGLLHVSEYNV